MSCIPDGAFLRGSLHPRLEKMPITVLGHPACARQVTIVHVLRTLRIGVRIEAEHDLDHLTPVGALLGRVEQPEIRGKMGFIIGVHPVGQRRAVLESGLTHQRVPEPVPHFDK